MAFIVAFSQFAMNFHAKTDEFKNFLHTDTNDTNYHESHNARVNRFGSIRAAS